MGVGDRGVAPARVRPGSDYVGSDRARPIRMGNPAFFAIQVGRPSQSVAHGVPRALCVRQYAPLTIALQAPPGSWRSGSRVSLAPTALASSRAQYPRWAIARIARVDLARVSRPSVQREVLRAADRQRDRRRVRSEAAVQAAFPRPPARDNWRARIIPSSCVDLGQRTAAAQVTLPNGRAILAARP